MIFTTDVTDEQKSDYLAGEKIVMSKGGRLYRGWDSLLALLPAIDVVHKEDGTP